MVMEVAEGSEDVIPYPHVLEGTTQISKESCIPSLLDADYR